MSQYIVNLIKDLDDQISNYINSIESQKRNIKRMQEGIISDELTITKLKEARNILLENDITMKLYTMEKLTGVKNEVNEEVDDEDNSDDWDQI